MDGAVGVIDDLRSRIVWLGRGPESHREQGVLPFGMAAIDNALPEGGIALGALHEVSPRERKASTPPPPVVRRRRSGPAVRRGALGDRAQRPLRSGPRWGRPVALAGDLCRRRPRRDSAGSRRRRSRTVLSRRDGRDHRHPCHDGHSAAAAGGGTIPHHRPAASALTQAGQSHPRIQRGHVPLARADPALASSPTPLARDAGPRSRMLADRPAPLPRRKQCILGCRGMRSGGPDRPGQSTVGSRSLLDVGNTPA